MTNSLWRKRQEPEQPAPKWQGARFDSALHDQPPQPEQEHDLSEQGRNRSAVLGNNIEAMMESGLSFLKALETTLKVYDHAVPKPPTALRSKT